MKAILNLESMALSELTHKEKIDITGGDAEKVGETVGYVIGYAVGFMVFGAGVLLYIAARKVIN